MRKTSSLYIFPRFAGVIVLALLLLGCIQYEAEIQIKPDGSGTLTQEILLTDFLEEIMASMMGGMFGGGDTKGTTQASAKVTLDTAKLKAAASALGDGVRFVSAQAVQKEGASGTRAVYSFSDITRLKLNQNPLAASGLPAQGPNVELDQVQFQFRKGKPAELAVLVRKPSSESVSAPKTAKSAGTTAVEASDPVADSLAKEMLQKFMGLRTAIYLVPQGEIVTTNAAHRVGNRITLLELDFTEMMKDEKKLAALQQSPPETIAEARKALLGIPGFKADPNDTLRVQFR